MYYRYIRLFFFFNDTATTEIYTLSLHDALPISAEAEEERARGDRLALRRPHAREVAVVVGLRRCDLGAEAHLDQGVARDRSEEHTSELQSRQYLVCRLLLEKKKNKQDKK